MDISENLIKWKPKGSCFCCLQIGTHTNAAFTGVPAVVDITAIRSEAVGKDKVGAKINLNVPVDLVLI